MTMSASPRTSPVESRNQRRYLRAPVPLHFPVEEEMPETRRHLFLRTTLFEVVQAAFGARATVGSEQLVFWDPTNPDRRCAPDLFVRLGVPDGWFDSWKTWERGAPHLVVEIVGKSDAADAPWDVKMDRFRRIGIREVV